MKCGGEDAKIDESKLDKESLETHSLHSKYMKIFSAERIALVKLTQTRDRLEGVLEDYYTGAIDGRSIGREPFQQRLQTKDSIRRKINQDADMIKVKLQIAEQEEKIALLQEIVNCLNRRSYLIKNAIEWVKWTQGSVM